MPTQTQFDIFSWSDHSKYRGPSWDAYIMRGGYEEIYQGSFGAQILLAFARARSVFSPNSGYRYTFPINLTPPPDLVNPVLLNFAAPIIPGGEGASNTYIRVYWAGDGNTLSTQDYRVKPFSASALASSDPGLLGELTGRLNQYMQLVTPPLTSKFFDYVQASTLNKLGYWDAGAINYGPLVLSGDSDGPAHTADSPPSNGTGKKFGLLPWIIGAAIFKGLLL